MKKFKYKDQIVTASSKDEAIKLIAKVGDGWHQNKKFIELMNEVATLKEIYDTCKNKKFGIDVGDSFSGPSIMFSRTTKKGSEKIVTYIEIGLKDSDIEAIKKGKFRIAFDTEDKNGVSELYDEKVVDGKQLLSLFKEHIVNNKPFTK